MRNAETILTIIRNRGQRGLVVQNVYRLLYQRNLYLCAYSGVRAGSIVGPVLSNIVLDRLDKYVENKIIPEYTRGRRRKTNPAYAELKEQERKAKVREDWKMVKMWSQKAQTIP